MKASLFFFRSVRPAFMLLVMFTVLLGGVYPLVVTLIAQTAFPHAAGGSLIERNGEVLGSSLVGREFTSAKYFWGRPSATTPSYNAAASQASNMSPFSPAYRQAVEDRMNALKQADPANRKPVPIELVTASGSGIDPHISPTAMEYQLPRVARARGMREEAVRKIAREHTQGAQLGIFGEPRVNVLLLNLALDEAGGR